MNLSSHGLARTPLPFTAASWSKATALYPSLKPIPLSKSMHSYLIVRIAHVPSSLNQMPESIVPAIWNDSAPKWLPSPINLVFECTKYGQGPSHRTLEQPAGSDAAFVKWGPMVAMSEARTQEFLAKQVNEDGNGIVRIPVVYFAFRYEKLGYIVMQYVGDRDCNKDDFPEIALAVERLLQIPSPTSVPGPFNGGAITHRFFAESMSSVPYSSVELLQEHINAVSSPLHSSCPSTIHMNYLRFSPAGDLNPGPISWRRPAYRFRSASTTFIGETFASARAVSSSLSTMRGPTSFPLLFAISPSRRAKSLQ